MFNGLSSEGSPQGLKTFRQRPTSLVADVDQKKPLPWGKKNMESEQRDPVYRPLRNRDAEPKPSSNPILDPQSMQAARPLTTRGHQGVPQRLENHGDIISNPPAASARPSIARNPNKIHGHGDIINHTGTLQEKKMGVHCDSYRNNANKVGQGLTMLDWPDNASCSSKSTTTTAPPKSRNADARLQRVTSLAVPFSKNTEEVPKNLIKSTDLALKVAELMQKKQNDHGRKMGEYSKAQDKFLLQNPSFQKGYSPRDARRPQTAK